MKYLNMCKVIEANTHLDQQKNGTRLSYRLPALSFTHLSVHLLPPVVTSPGATLQCLPGRARLSLWAVDFFLFDETMTKRGGFWLVFWLGFWWAFFAKATENHHQKLGPPNKKVAVWFREMGISTKTNLGW